MKESNILVVDDNKSILSALELLLKGRCKKVKVLSTPNLMLSELQKESYDVLLLDMNFMAGINSGNEGLYWLQRVLEKEPGLSIIMITAYGDVELAVKAIRLGAVDFVLKPWDNEKMLATVESAIRLSHSRKEVKKLKLKEKQLIAEINRPGQALIGSSPAWKAVMDFVAKVASTQANVLITGENGTGKELIAREIHRQSSRADKVMVTVDMGSITETLFESELFGHKKGAFTDAQTDRVGKIETAHEGTLFLDEIGNLPLPMQSKLLSVLQNRVITRVGDNNPVPVDIRLICATNCNLLQMVSNGSFREDLLYRINTIHIELPRCGAGNRTYRNWPVTF
ncbi:MAG: sigma-54 dependent transcriptional regulator [Bacteroidales bacterium]|nr:sigma-54 dependent transcriptional regulator [Bacteroidales bacterium]